MMTQFKSTRIGGEVPHVTSALAAAPHAQYETTDLRAGNAISVFGNAVLSAGIEFPDLRIDD